MSKPLMDRIPFAKIITVLAIAFGIGLGLCGLSVALTNAGYHNSAEQFSADTFGIGTISLVVMLLSAFGLVIAVIALVLAGILGSLGSKRGDSETIRLFDDKDDGEKSN